MPAKKKTAAKKAAKKPATSKNPVSIFDSPEVQKVAAKNAKTGAKKEAAAKKKADAKTTAKKSTAKKTTTAKKPAKAAPAKKAPAKPAKTTATKAKAAKAAVSKYEPTTGKGGKLINISRASVAFADRLGGRGAKAIDLILAAYDSKDHQLNLNAYEKGSDTQYQVANVISNTFVDKKLATRPERGVLKLTQKGVEAVERYFEKCGY